MAMMVVIGAVLGVGWLTLLPFDVESKWYMMIVDGDLDAVGCIDKAGVEMQAGILHDPYLGGHDNDLTQPCPHLLQLLLIHKCYLSFLIIPGGCFVIVVVHSNIPDSVYSFVLDYECTHLSIGFSFCQHWDIDILGFSLYNSNKGDLRHTFV